MTCYASELRVGDILKTRDWTGKIDKIEYPSQGSVLVYIGRKQLLFGRSVRVFLG